MRKIICNLIIMGALSLSTHIQAQHLLESLDAPDSISGIIGFNPNAPGSGIGDIKRNDCIAKGYLYSPNPLLPECSCPNNGDYISTVAEWNGKNWVCNKSKLPKGPIDDDECINHECDKINK